MQKINSDREISGLKKDSEELKATVTDLKGRLGSISDIVGDQENDEKISDNNKNNSTDNKVPAKANTDKNEDKNTIAGTWRFSKVYAEGVQEDDWRYVFGSAGLGDGLILKKDKTFVDEVGNAMSSEDTIEGTYEIDGNNVILTFANGVVKTLKYDSKTETLDFPNYLQGCELILKK